MPTGDQPNLLTLFSMSLVLGANSPALANWHALTSTETTAEQAHNDNDYRQQEQQAKALIASGEAQQRLAQLQQQGWQLIITGDDYWPPLLNGIEDEPALLYVRGEASLLRRPQIAIVGSRHASPEGCRHARTFAKQLCQSGCVITSGLAFGIDAAAHQGTLKQGQTIAVLAHGPDRLYPARHRLLAEQIINEGGALMTEFPPGTAPLRPLFPQRNRIISGMCLATLVIEAAQRSGTLVTARLAAEQGRPVFAMPGAIHNPLSKGCHELLRDGACWLESLDDIADAIPDWINLSQALNNNGTTESPFNTNPLMRFFEDGINSIDALQQRSQLDSATLMQTLTELEISGLISQSAGGYIRV